MNRARQDEALTLVPPTWAPTIDLYVQSYDPKRNVWRTFLRKYEEDQVTTLHATAPTSALALCIAALCAMASLPYGVYGFAWAIWRVNTKD